MLFNSYIFIFLFLPLVLFGYYGLCYAKQNKLALVFLAGMSCWFIGYMNIKYLVIVLISILSNYVLVKCMQIIKRQQYRQYVLGIGIVWNIGVLFLYKYYNFFIENVNGIFKTDFAFLELVLPLGISFYTFQQIAYLVDSYRKECEDYTFLEYVVYITFFPKLVQGPLASHKQIIEAFREQNNWQINYENMSKGIYSFTLGLAKKVLIADTLSPLIAQGYYNPNGMNATTTLLIMLSYTLQIYYDFSGYCDMAMGVGYMLNVKLPINFNSPYKAISIDEFWDRWHMTLTQFFTKYVYFPLGGSRKGTVRTYVNIMIVFLLSGLWHGANWTFMIWGAMHGIAKVIERIGKKWINKIPKLIRGCVTFIYVTVAWSLFRASSLAQAKELWGQIFVGEYSAIQTPFTEIFNNLLEVKVLMRVGLEGVIERCPSLPLLIFVLGITIACFVMKNTQQKLDEFKGSNFKIGTIIILLLWCLASLTNASEFLYVNF